MNKLTYNNRKILTLAVLFAFFFIFTGINIYSAQAAITFVGSASSTGASADFTLSLTALRGGSGSAPAEGDLVIVSSGLVSTTNQNPGVSTAGYTEEADLYASDSDDANLSVNWKIMTASPDTSVTCLGSTVSTNGAACVAYVWRGVNRTTPLDVTTTTAVPANNIGSSVPDSPSIQPVTSGAIVVAAGAGADAAADFAVTAPSGYTNQVATSTDPGLAIILGMGSKAWSGSGAEDPAVWTNWTTTAAGSWVAATLALRPATVPGAPTIGTATAGNAEASAAFTAPADDGGSPITGYTVTSSPGGITGTGAASPITVTGLSNGTAYTFTVHATNVLGNSTESSASNSVTPAASTAPTVTTNVETGVTSFSSILQGNISATGGVNPTVRGFAWGTNSALSGGDTSTTTESGSFGTGTFSQFITNLLAGRRYYYRAYATNSIGTSYGAIDFLDTSAASSAATRRARLFNGYRIKLINTRFIIHQN